MSEDGPKLYANKPKKVTQREGFFFAVVADNGGGSGFVTAATSAPEGVVCSALQVSLASALDCQSGRWRFIPILSFFD
ncbi:hypothetical protein ACFX13_025440 [Malus domestica]